MKVWDLVNSEAFKKASNDTPIWYANGSLGYAKMGCFAQIMCEFQAILIEEKGKALTKKDLLNKPLLILNYQLMVSTDIVPLNTQGCVVVLEDCGIVIKERDMI